MLQTWNISWSIKKNLDKSKKSNKRFWIFFSHGKKSWMILNYKVDFTNVLNVMRKYFIRFEAVTFSLWNSYRVIFFIIQTFKHWMWRYKIFELSRPEKVGTWTKPKGGALVIPGFVGLKI